MSLREKKNRRPKIEFLIIDILCDFLKEGMQNEEIRNEIDLKIASENLNAIYFHSLMIWLHSDNGNSFSRDISAKIDFLFEGIGG
ncbi:MAG: hypothetical protein RBT65_13680 [Methanolobus sp.]|jgi:hypothetical protein|nr:hypothetical protein [Methanolobus sp.]